MRSASAIFMSHTEAITCLPQTITLHGCENEWEIKGVQRQHPDASTVAPAVVEKAHLGMKQR